MSDATKVIAGLFKLHNINIPAGRMGAFEQFTKQSSNEAAINAIIENQEILMARWSIDNRIAEIMEQPVRVLNATVGKPYETLLDFKKLKWDDVESFGLLGLEEVGLHFDEEKGLITGVPTQSGDIKALLRFKIKGQPEEAGINEKPITIIINPDPKSLWKKVESDKNDRFWKEDDLTVFAPLAGRHLLVSSKRGRSHANVGSFREDDFAFKNLDQGWSIIVVADGAGSAKVSRKGSAIACTEAVEYFMQPEAIKAMEEFDELVQHYSNNTGEEIQQKLNRLVYNNLGKAAFHMHKKLEAFAKQENIPLKDLNSTLIFTCIKKYESGYACLTFGVGDCPIAILSKDLTEVTLMNWLDVGEFGGGTRFITMPEIFQNNKFATRFGFKLVQDFSYLFMMSDGIYDPKFVVEANLPKTEKWREFIADIQGNNPEGIKVDLDASNKAITDQFSAWMDFWSPGNHDDRTLAILF